MSLRSASGVRRDWAFWAHALLLIGIWTSILVAAAFFGWRTWELHRHGDAWRRSIGIGGFVALLFTVYAALYTWLFVRIGATANGVSPVVDLDQTTQALTRNVLVPWSWRRTFAAFGLAAVAGWGVYCWWRQLTIGLSVTGLGRPVFWGFYIVNFEYLATTAYGVVLFAAILRLVRAEWRRPITRTAEVMAVLVVAAGAWNIFLDLGRPDRAAIKFFVWGRGESPLIWDMTAITTFLVSAAFYLYVSLIPDLGLLRRRVGGWRAPVYHLLSFGWANTDTQRHAIKFALAFLSVLIIPVTVMVLSVVGWVFATTVQPGWHSSIFGPYYVVGALFQGVAALTLVLALIRRYLELGKFILPAHFSALGVTLLGLSFLWTYFTASELLTVYYGDEPIEMAVLRSKWVGAFSPLTWTTVVACVVIPVLMLARRRTVASVTTASFAILVGMWVERYTTVIPTLAQPRLPVPAGSYAPTWVELSLLAAAISLAGLLFMIFTRCFPIVSLWEETEGQEKAARNAATRIRSYFPSEEPPMPAAAPREGT
jgi:molybdopterin-containing oxidoreductase family membrane subunit